VLHVTSFGTHHIHTTPMICNQSNLPTNRWQQCSPKVTDPNQPPRRSILLVFLRFPVVFHLLSI
jgi:hypothetical protein